MARTKGVNKTPAVKAYLRKNPNATAQQVVDGLRAEGMEVSTSLVFNVRAAAKKKKAGRRRTRTMKTASTNGTKADLIRETAGGLEKPIRPRDVVAVLRDQGIEVSRAQVSQVLQKMGMRKRRRRRKAAAGVAAVASNSGSLDINDLVAAKKLINEIGSVEKVREALAALARLG